MNTSAHVALGLIGARVDRTANRTWPVVLGSLLPDLPMLYFYAWAKLSRIPEAVIWSETYYQVGWQAFFDTFNSIPIAAAALTLGLARKLPSLTWFSVAMLLHIAADLPLHHDDGHRHLFPFSDWRFQSPVSYWDPAHHGSIVFPLEMVMVLGACLFLMKASDDRLPRWMAAATLAIHVAYLGFVAAVWM